MVRDQRSATVFCSGTEPVKDIIPPQRLDVMRCLATSIDYGEDPWDKEREFDLGSPLEESDEFFIKQCQWTADGSSIVTASEDYAIRLFVVPPTLLDESVTPLKPFMRRFGPSPVVSHAVYPGFNLQEWSTCGIAVSRKNVPVKIYSALSSNSAAEASFPIIKGEDYLPAYDIKFMSMEKFVCGSLGRVVLFDLSRENNGDTIAVKKSDIVSSIAISPSRSIIAIGTFSGYCSLIDLNTHETIDTVQLENSNGVTQMLWRDDDLLIFQRNCTNFAIYNTRTNSIITRVAYGGSSRQRIINCIASDGSVYFKGPESSLQALDRDSSSPRSLATLDGLNSVDVHPRYGNIVAIARGSRHHDSSFLSIYDINH
ncbi:hypothetical protein TRVA0_001S05204 [Trichomonascus vanleenenianus]|uniref:Swt21p n=1 Tax=Trichomonascus vanleenenianus TaxID=2268995 RepID=UPI003ECA3707